MKSEVCVCVCVCVSHTPVGHVDADDARLQQLSVLVGASGQQPALVVGQAIAHEEHVVFLRGLAERLGQVRLLVLHRRQDERRRVQSQALGPLAGKGQEGKGQRSSSTAT